MSSVTFRLRGPKKHRDSLVETIRSRWTGNVDGRISDHPPYTEVALAMNVDFDYVEAIHHVTDGMFRVNPNRRDGKATWVGEGRRKVGLELTEIRWASGGATVWDGDDPPEMVEARRQRIAMGQDAYCWEPWADPAITPYTPFATQVDIRNRLLNNLDRRVYNNYSYGTWDGMHPEEAQRRAEQLLSEMLTPEEQQQLKDNQYLEVPSTVRQGRVYRIPNLTGYVAVYEDGNHTENLCVQPTETIPDADWILLQKLMIQGNEQEWLKIANHFPVARNRWHVADEQAARVTPFYTLRVTDACAEDALQGWHVRLRDLMAERNVLQRVRASIFTESAYQTNKAVSWRRDPETVAGDALIEESPQYMRVVIRRLEDGEVPGSDTELECVPA